MDAATRQLIKQDTLAPWMSEEGASSLVERNQDEAVATLQRLEDSVSNTVKRLDSLREMEKKVRTHLHQVQMDIKQTQFDIYSQAEEATSFLDRQPACQYLQAARASIERLERQGELSLARSIAGSIAGRLNRPPPLMLQGEDFIDNIPQLQSIIAAVEQLRANPGIAGQIEADFHQDELLDAGDAENLSIEGQMLEAPPVHGEPDEDIEI